MDIDINCISEFVNFSLRFCQPLLIYFETLNSWKQLRSLFPLDRRVLLLLHNPPLCLQEAIFFVLKIILSSLSCFSTLKLSRSIFSSTSRRLPCFLSWNERLASWAECSYLCVSTVPIMACAIWFLYLTQWLTSSQYFLSVLVLMFLFFPDIPSSDSSFFFFFHENLGNFRNFLLISSKCFKLISRGRECTS